MYAENSVKTILQESIKQPAPNPFFTYIIIIIKPIDYTYNCTFCKKIKGQGKMGVYKQIAR